MMISKKRFAAWLVVGFCFIFCGCNFSLSIQNNLPHNNLSNTAISSIDVPPVQDFRIVVISDLNSQYGSTEYEPEVKEAIALMPQWQPDLVLSGGDMIAGQKASLSKPQIEAMWQSFEEHIAKPLRQNQIPFGFTIGNHDGSGAIKQQSLVFPEERELAKAYWHQPQHKLGLNFIDRSNFPFYYSFQQSNIFFLVWDASTSNISEQQLDWVKQTLNSPAATNADLRIAIGHLPLYPVATAKNKPGEYLADGAKLRSLLEQHQVHTYISGHHHVYYPGKLGDLELLHAGALGQGARKLIGSDLSPRQTLTVIDLNQKSSELTYHTYDATTWNLISIEELPASITANSDKIIRRDLAN